MVDAISLLKELVKIDSSTKELANEAVHFCEKWLASFDINATVLENNGFLMLVAEIGSGERTLILNGHVDVVPGNEDQFEPYVEGNKLYGRGSADMKAGLAAMMGAFVELKNDSLPCKVQLQIVSDEETGGLNCAQFLSDQGYLGDFVICGEPTQLNIGLQAKGIVQVDVTIKGSAAHGSRPWEGDNAIQKALRVYEEILSLPFTKESSPMYERPSVNLAKISGGDAYNRVPDMCVISVDIRFLPEQTKERVLAELNTISDIASIHVHSDGDPIATKEDDPYVQKLYSIVNKTSHEAILFGQHGSADGRFYSRFGIPAVEFGPRGAHWHGEKEYVEIDSVYLYQDILKKLAHLF
ncbi:M20 family metallopeptidase [Priestia koreensis]|uniref:Succinyl-diaminopimelate desuccinylase n=1 Tax=Priestia koreensis TaxID=284581 RepID=A0A0M0KWB7_9BACI|nr:M20 family metallopeptidase [Priestia koreensis]KOO42912.1 succinyl-diaminopimelate desuccinylase [Priestia koreensis]